MKIHLQKEIDQLKKRLFHLSALVEENLEKAIRAVVNSDRELARAVRAADREIDLIEVEVEEECLKILALHQPVAVDLRYLVAVLKMNNDLERIGDLAASIARGKGCHLGQALPPKHGEMFRELGLMARTMLHDSLDSLMNLDAKKAHRILLDDDEVDAKYHELSRMLSAEVAANPQQAETMICWLLAAKSIERVADLATNIAEDTIYTIEGVIIRHGVAEDREN